MGTYVLVHGAWHGGWCWRRVTPLLQAAGHAVFTPTLTGLGERFHLASAEVDLDTHVQDVVNLLEFEELRDVILVGHSYGGMVITGVTERAADRLQHVVYLDAFVPRDGQALVDLLTPQFRDDLRQQAHASGGRLPPFPVERYGVFAAADVAWVTPKLVPHPAKTMTTPVSLTQPQALALPKTYVYCNKPAMGPFDQFVEQVRTTPGWQYRELATGHDAMVTMPHELTELLLELA
ncbi:MAG: alpha/beta hydrolase [Deltaproteobacteria bacterium]|nr:alpha/beta hydrolase [Deltaproteobacteria bacterium]